MRAVDFNRAQQPGESALGEEMMRAAKSKQPKSKSARKESQRQRLDKALEEGLEETFPASDALAITPAPAARPGRRRKRT
jgi:hypothetical protein